MTRLNFFGHTMYRTNQLVNHVFKFCKLQCWWASPHKGDPLTEQSQPVSKDHVATDRSVERPKALTTLFRIHRCLPGIRFLGPFHHNSHKETQQKLWMVSSHAIVSLAQDRVRSCEVPSKEPNWYLVVALCCPSLSRFRRPHNWRLAERCALHWKNFDRMFQAQAVTVRCGCHRFGSSWFDCFHRCF